jgi:S-adenosylmethionine:tRNA ribosyltransferase-isomerase
MTPFPIDYVLPPELIAQEPCEPRDQARLMVASRVDQSIRHHRFFDLPELLRPGDLLVLNDTRVVPARLLGRRAKTGGRWEGLFLRECATNPERQRGDDDAPVWELLSQTRGTLLAGEIIELISPGQANPSLALRATQRLADGRWHMTPLAPGTTIELLERHGRVPLPPYIRKGVEDPRDRERYQTIYARQAGAVAAPTAGLHFTERVFAGLKERGVEWTQVTLHVGLATFQPVQVDDYTQHRMHREWGQIDQPAVDAIQACKSRGGRVVAVGTTAVRVLETAARSEPEASAKDGASFANTSGSELRVWSGETDLYIHPPYEFQIVDALITNFHLPRTTLLLLVAAFAGVDLMRSAYEAAIAERYRFYSYGDAMLILP